MADFQLCAGAGCGGTSGEQRDENAGVDARS
jgi:hypothetical protein